DPNTGVYTYTPPPGFTGDDSFEYTICDNGTPQLCDTAVVVITVSPDNGNITVANDDAYHANNCAGITGNVLDNDTDPEGDTQTVNTVPVDDVNNGTLVLNADGTFTYTPNAGFTGTDSFVYSVCDSGTPQACDQATVYITLIDSTPPNIDNCDISDQVIECSGSDNESIIEAWNDANIALLEACAQDGCNTDLTGQVTSDYDFTNFETTCGLSGNITITYTITDGSGNITTVQATLTIEDTTAPEVTNCDVSDMTLDCTLNDAKDIANQWNLDNIETLENCATDGCSLDPMVTVTSDYDFDNLTSGQLPVIYTIADTCGNEATVELMLTLQNTGVTSSNISLCVESEVESQIFNLFNLLDGNYNTGGTWEVVLGDGTIIDDNFFDPKSVNLNGENASELITFSYTESDSDCPTYIEATIEVHNRCGVLACDIDNLEISIVVTPNGDAHNEYFTVTGIEDCDFIVDVKIVNRWGTIIYESHDYKNNWNALSHRSSVGPAGQVPTGTYYYVVTLINSGLENPIVGPMFIGTK
ncbi:tandem-95 repeat protein, partial [Flaviramulus multivorans]